MFLVYCNVLRKKMEKSLEHDLICNKEEIYWKINLISWRTLKFI